MRDLSRLLNPRNIAVVGGGAWCNSIVGAARRIGFKGDILPVHPKAKTIAGIKALRRLQDWTDPIDAAFIGVNRHATLEIVADLHALNAGGAVCFASGFTEAQSEDAAGAGLQARLVKAAGGMPVLGPNCYGFINALDRVAIWPDQHGMQPVDRGVAILTQSSNMAINLTMQRRALPIAYMVTCGNMAQTSQAEIAQALLEDDRVTAIGLHVEGFGNLRDWEILAQKAHAQGVHLATIKVGASDQARQATLSHTASLAGSDAGAQALLDRLGISRLNTLPEFLETLKLLHCHGPLANNTIASISCSGGEASLMADLAKDRDLIFPGLSNSQRSVLNSALGPMVALANPLDYHTYIWRDDQKMAQAWAGMTGPDIAMTFSIVDYPGTDHSDWSCATNAALAVRKETGAPFAVVSSLPELMPEDVAQTLMDGGVVPFSGLDEALAACQAASGAKKPHSVPLVLPNTPVGATETLDEDQAKKALAEFGLVIPHSVTARDCATIGKAIAAVKFPVVAKALGLAHKTEHGAVALNLQSAAAVKDACRDLPRGPVMIEEMVTGTVAELIVGITHDPAHGFVLTIGAGGVLAEIMQDTVSLLIPSSRDQIQMALSRLKSKPLLMGYRGRPAAHIPAIVSAIESIQAYVVANADSVVEVEVNPLICTSHRAVAADALVRKAQE